MLLPQLKTPLKSLPLLRLNASVRAAEGDCL